MKRVQLLSVRTETPEGGVVVRGGANVSAGPVFWLDVAPGGTRTVVNAAEQMQKLNELAGT